MKCHGMDESRDWASLTVGSSSGRCNSWGNSSSRTGLLVGEHGHVGRLWTLTNCLPELPNVSSSTNWSRKRGSGASNLYVNARRSFRKADHSVSHTSTREECKTEQSSMRAFWPVVLCECKVETHMAYFDLRVILFNPICSLRIHINSAKIIFIWKSIILRGF